MKKTELVTQLEQKCKILDSLIVKGIINNDELKTLLNVDINEMINVKIYRTSTFKKKCMFNIYFNPYILYFSNKISNEVKENLPRFIKYRYLQEKKEYDNKLEYGEITKKIYKDEIENLQMHYFYSSPIGTNIG